jgi:HlyD family secretion protein
VHRNTMGSPANLRMKSSADPTPGFDCDQRSLDRAQFETMSNRSGHDKGQRKWLLLLILVTGIVAWFLVQKKFTRTEPLFRTTKVTRGDIRQTVTATGEIDPIESVTIGCQICGQISRVFVTYNDQVKKGQVIAELDPASYKAALAYAEGNLANAEAARDLARIQARRQEELLRRHVVAPSDYDQAIATLKQDEAEVKMRQADLEKATVDRVLDSSPL